MEVRPYRIAPLANQSQRRHRDADLEGGCVCCEVEIKLRYVNGPHEMRPAGGDKEHGKRSAVQRSAVHAATYALQTRGFRLVRYPYRTSDIPPRTRR